MTYWMRWAFIASVGMVHLFGPVAAVQGADRGACTWCEIRLLALSAGGETAVVQDPDGSLRVVRPGDPILPSPAEEAGVPASSAAPVPQVRRVLEDRLELTPSDPDPSESAVAYWLYRVGRDGASRIVRLDRNAPEAPERHAPVRIESSSPPETEEPPR